jgi:glycosyltransferase involved in cell wall biosynthesis
MKVIFCIPTTKKPYQATLDSLAASIPLIKAAGWEEGMVSEIGCPYISHARATMLRKALDAKADVIVFIDHDVSWKPQDLLTLIETKGDVVCGTYRFKKDEEEYMGVVLSDTDGTPLVRDDGNLLAHSAPAGFLKVTKEAVNKFMTAYPELVYGEKYYPCVDLFNHGAYKGTWYGEDYAFCRNWRECGGEIVLIPDLDISHHTTEKEYVGNFHNFLRKQPGGDLYEG